MSRWPEALLLALLVGTSQPGSAAEDFPGIGRVATTAELRAWDIDVRADFRGLPPGSGSVSRGRELFVAKCAACHGEKGDSPAMVAPLIGGTTPEDIASGHAHALRALSPAPRTTFMKVPTISSLFDYIRRAMPWDKPKSLAPDEVYAVLAYLLNLAQIVPADFTLSDGNIAEVQAKLPNRNGMSTDHGLWPGAPASRGGMGNGGKPDVHSSACMRDCDPAAMPGPVLPLAARDAHGSLDGHNRSIGPVRGTPAAVR